ncbi:hypothetical protein ABEB22_16155 (plasmid) [Thioclava sp. 'Guangxiensis']|uniref:hypothetical protein n=1 Tax=Thioclava sp. 'Guangxiensis' TaxID=3149044 RepID=UPI0032C4A7EC
MAKRKNHSADLKAKVALKAIREEMTLAELPKKYGVHSNMISGWKCAAVTNMAQAFEPDQTDRARASEAEIEKPHSRIGQLVVEWFLSSSASHQLLGAQGKNGERGSSVEAATAIRTTAAGLYYRPVGESAESLRFMDLIDKQFLEAPWYGSRQMADTSSIRGLNAAATGYAV